MKGMLRLLLSNLWFLLEFLFLYLLLFIFLLEMLLLEEMFFFLFIVEFFIWE